MFQHWGWFNKEAQGVDDPGVDHVVNQCLCSIFVFPVQHIRGLDGPAGVTEHLLRDRKGEPREGRE